VHDPTKTLLEAVAILLSRSWSDLIEFAPHMNLRNTPREEIDPFRGRRRNVCISETWLMEASTELLVRNR
jgi:hypothetical protein